MTLTDLIAACRKKGTDKQFREWVSFQPSCVSGQFSEWVNGQGRCIACHIRRAGESGTAFKAEYSCVPMTHAEHLIQHQHGETAFGGKDWFDRQREKYLRRWLAS